MNSLLCIIVDFFVANSIYFNTQTFKKQKWGHGIHIGQSVTCFFPSPIYHGHRPGQYLWISLIC